MIVLGFDGMHGGHVPCGVTAHGSPSGPLQFDRLEAALAARFHRYAPHRPAASRSFPRKCAIMHQKFAHKPRNAATEYVGAQIDLSPSDQNGTAWLRAV